MHKTNNEVHVSLLDIFSYFDMNVARVTEKKTLYCCAGKKVEEYRRMLGQFGVTGDMALQQIGMLLFLAYGNCRVLELRIAD